MTIAKIKKLESEIARLESFRDNEIECTGYVSGHTFNMLTNRRQQLTIAWEDYVRKVRQAFTREMKMEYSELGMYNISFSTMTGLFETNKGWFECEISESGMKAGTIKTFESHEYC